MSKPRATVARKKSPMMAMGRNRKRNQNQQKTHPYLGDIEL